MCVVAERSVYVDPASLHPPRGMRGGMGLGDEAGL
jgi:hypothetical protein